MKSMIHSLTFSIAALFSLTATQAMAEGNAADQIKVYSVAKGEYVMTDKGEKSAAEWMRQRPGVSSIKLP